MNMNVRKSTAIIFIGSKLTVQDDIQKISMYDAVKETIDWLEDCGIEFNWPSEKDAELLETLEEDVSETS